MAARVNISHLRHSKSVKKHYLRILESTEGADSSRAVILRAAIRRLDERIKTLEKRRQPDH